MKAVTVLAGMPAYILDRLEMAVPNVQIFGLQLVPHVPVVLKTASLSSFASWPCYAYLPFYLFLPPIAEIDRDAIHYQRNSQQDNNCCGRVDDKPMLRAAHPVVDLDRQYGELVHRRFRGKWYVGQRTNHDQWSRFSNRP